MATPQSSDDEQAVEPRNVEELDLTYEEDGRKPWRVPVERDIDRYVTITREVVRTAYAGIPFVFVAYYLTVGSLAMTGAIDANVALKVGLGSTPLSIVALRVMRFYFSGTDRTA